MKTSTLVVCAISVLVAGCGSGSSEVPDSIRIIGPSQVVQDVEVTAPSMDQPVNTVVGDPPTVDLPATVVNQPSQPVTDVQPGDLADLYGALGFGFGFEGSEVVFSFGMVFNAENLNVTDSGTPYLASATEISTTLTPGAEPIVGPPTTVGCLYSASIDQFQCLLDVAGPDQSVFTFGRPVDNDVIFGSFEFCGEVALDDCTSEVFLSPDGAVAVAAFPLPVASTSGMARSADLVATDITPYFQYLEQASNVNVQSPGYSQEYLDTLSKAAKTR
ncbi:MAG: hypothetical protein AB8B97_16170 [Granulosicoccus sp.]